MDGRSDIQVRGRLVVLSDEPGRTVRELGDSCADIAVSETEIPASGGVEAQVLVSGDLPPDTISRAVSRAVEAPEVQLLVDVAHLSTDLRSFSPLGVEDVGWLGNVPVVALSLHPDRPVREVDDLWARLLASDPRQETGREPDAVARLRAVAADLTNRLEDKNERLIAQRERVQRNRERFRHEKAARAKADRRRESLERSRGVRATRALGAAARSMGGRRGIVVAGAIAFLLVAILAGWLAAVGGLGAGVLASLAFIGFVVAVVVILWTVRRTGAAAGEHRRAVQNTLETLVDRQRELVDKLEIERVRHVEEWQEIRVAVRRLEAGQARTADAVRTLDTAMSKDVSRRTVENSAQLAQIQSVVRLFSILPVEGRVPAMGGWAASPDLIEVVVDEMVSRRPSLVVECGSGVSTLWFGLAIRHFGFDCKVVALEHHEGFAEQTRAVLTRHGLDDIAEVRLAPLTEVEVAGYHGRWYDPQALSTLSDVGLLLVDGPPAATGVHARFPAVPMLRERFADSVSIVLDDMIRKDEQEVARMWEDLLPGFSRQDLSLQKRATVFRRG